jgi:cell division protein FtsN
LSEKGCLCRAQRLLFSVCTAKSRFIISYLGMLSSKASCVCGLEGGKMIWRSHFKTISITIAVVLAGCATVEENPKKNAQLGLITTPPTYYTTQRARYLGEKYKNNLDRLVERIVRNPKTANLQFANNIASVGGIGFFTHSATSSVDERYLEIIMGVPETFDSQLDNNAKVHRVFSLYGAELLSILASDSEIYQEKEVSGYGLNLSWRNLVSDAGSRISLERATLYFPKAKVRSFVRGELNQNSFLSEAVIFAVIDDGPMKLVSYQPQELKSDSRRPIEEEPLVAGRTTAKLEPQSEKTASLSAVTKRPVVAKEPENSSVQSLSLRKDKVAESQVPFLLGEKFEDSNERAGTTAKLTEVPTELSSKETLQTRDLPVIHTKEVVVGKQESVRRETVSTSLEQKQTESEYVTSPGDLASLPVVPATATITDGPKVVSLKEQSPLESKPTKASSGGQPATKALQGFVIQLAFGETRDARLWAETLERRGFAVSLTEASGSGSVRVRIGNFVDREEAERQLQALRRDGLKGIVLNLPHAYRPEVHTGNTEQNQTGVSAVQ